MISLGDMKKIRICTEASCVAWSADVGSQKLELFREQLELLGYQVCPTECMNRCGGGISLDAPFCQSIFKLKDPPKVYDFIFQG